MKLMDKQTVITTTDPHAIARMNAIISQAGQAADEQAARVAFADQTASKEARHIDDNRLADGMQTRIGAKKAEAVSMTQDLAEAWSG
jgi:hypothetical protein